VTTLDRVEVTVTLVRICGRGGLPTDQITGRNRKNFLWMDGQIGVPIY